MDKAEVYKIWAPTDAVWSPWVKPVLFSWADSAPSATQGTSDIVTDDLRYLPEAADRSIVIVDLPGALSLRCGLELAKRGFRPIPLYNNIPGPMPERQAPLFYFGETGMVIDVRPILSLVWHNSAWLNSLNLPIDAPPAFLLDSKRFPVFLAQPSRYFDNRWLIFSEDFPSAAKFQEQNLSRVVIIQPHRTARLDLRQVLSSWQEKGLALQRLRYPARKHPVAYVAKKPSFVERLYLRLSQDSLWGDSKHGFGAIRFHPG